MFPESKTTGNAADKSLQGMSKEEEAKLCLSAQAGDELALERMVRANLGLVHRTARRYRRQNVALDDLVNEGSLGLMRAVRKFNPSFGLPFVPYAIWWVKQAMIMFLIQHGQGVISLPIRKVQLLKRIRREESTLESLFGRKPTDQELSQHLGRSPEEIHGLRNSVPEYVAWEDYIEEPGSNHPRGRHPAEVQVDRHRLRKALESLVHDLPTRDQRGVRLYFGLEGDGFMNYADLGRSLEMTREGARQMIKRSLLRLRANPASLPLASYL
jgi:RNA polymerase sigma factor (sigma-70 family)